MNPRPLAAAALIALLVAGLGQGPATAGHGIAPVGGHPTDVPPSRVDVTDTVDGAMASASGLANATGRIVKVGAGLAVVILGVSMERAEATGRGMVDDSAAIRAAAHNATSGTRVLLVAMLPACPSPAHVVEPLVWGGYVTAREASDAAAELTEAPALPYGTMVRELEHGLWSGLQAMMGSNGPPVLEQGETCLVFIVAMSAVVGLLEHVAHEKAMAVEDFLRAFLAA